MDGQFIARHRVSPKDFTRRRSLPFPTLVLFLMNLLKQSVQDELDRFFALVFDREVEQEEVTQSAFTKARKKLEYEAFVELNDRSIEVFYEQAPVRRWHGYRVLATDGSILRLPESAPIRKFFEGNPEEVAQGRLVELFDVLNEVMVAAEFSPMLVGEDYHAECLLSRAQVGDLVLYDRGFPSFYLFSLHAALGIDYCMRTSLSQFKAVKEFAGSGEKERWVEIAPCAKARKLCSLNGLGVSPIRVRLVRVDLPDGQVEVLMTSLGNAIVAEEFAALYHLRWGAEEAYKRHKCRGQLENFSGKTVQSLYQDIHAKLLSMNLAAIFGFSVAEQAQKATAHRKYLYRINLAKAISKVKKHLVCLLLGKRGRLQQLLQWIAKDVEAVRPGRQFERRNPKQRKPGFHMAYKPCA